MPPLLTLTTDFGLADPYVAAMKGVIWTICPAARIADLTHEIPRHDIMEAALFLAGAVPYYPPRTIHIAVVDPGVGTHRRPIVAEIRGQYILCPDNGLLTLLTGGVDPKAVRLISNPDVVRSEISATFHGRDIFAPAAAHLASGVEFESLGDPCEDIVQLKIPQAKRETNAVVGGQIIHIDQFGNLVTNIHCSSLVGSPQVAIRAKGISIHGIKKTYADVPSGQALALIGSSGYLEIAVNGAHAANELGLALRTPIEVTFQ